MKKKKAENCVKSGKKLGSVEYYNYFCRWVRDVNGQKPKMPN